MKSLSRRRIGIERMVDLEKKTEREIEKKEKQKKESQEN